MKQPKCFSCTGPKAGRSAKALRAN